MAPPRNNAPTETCMTPPQTIIRIDGGMMTPITEEQAVIATANRVSYPSFCIAGIRILPMPAASAVDDPEIPAKSIDTATFTWPSPPGSQPVSTRASSIRRSVTLPEFIRFAARRKKGTASRMKEL